MKKNKLPYAITWVVKHKDILNARGFEKFSGLPTLTLATFFHKKFFPKRHEQALQDSVDLLTGNDTWKTLIGEMIWKYSEQLKEFREFKDERHKKLLDRQKENTFDVRHQQTFDNIIMMYVVLNKNNPPMAEYLKLEMQKCFPAMMYIFDTVTEKNQTEK